MLNNINLEDRKWIELIFLNKNKAYGAYKLRKNYNKNMSLALISAVLIFSLPILIPFLAQFIKHKPVINNEPVHTLEISDLTLPPPIDPTLPPPPQVSDPLPPPVRSAVKFTPPVIKKDSEVPKRLDPPPVLDDIKQDVGIKTVSGKDDAPAKDPDLDNDQSITGDNQIFLHVEEAPQFPGGLPAFYKYIGENIKYPPLARESGIQGRVFIQFVVEKDGSITDVKVLKGIGYGCDEEALRVVKNSPNWSPGKQNGKAVRVQYNLPIVFQLR